MSRPKSAAIAVNRGEPHNKFLPEVVTVPAFAGYTQRELTVDHIDQ
jgi:hypothetical protein